MDKKLLKNKIINNKVIKTINLFYFFIIFNFLNYNFDFLHIGFGGGGLTPSNLAPNEDFKNIMSIIVYVTKLIGFAIILFIGLDILKMLNEPQKNNSSEGINVLLKFLAAGIFLGAETIAKVVFGITLVN